MASFKLTGEIIDIKDELQVTDRFTKRELWVDIPGSRGPQTLSFEVANQNCSKLDDFSIGERIEIEFSVRGRIRINVTRHYMHLKLHWLETGKRRRIHQNQRRHRHQGKGGHRQYMRNSHSQVILPEQQILKG